MSTPYQSPISQPGEHRIALEPWENILSGVVILASAAYAVVCVVHIVVLNAIITIANQELAGNPPSVATVQAKVNLDNHVNTAVNVILWTMYLLFIGWMISLNSRFRSAGRGGTLRRMPAWIVWRVGVVASFLLVIVLRSNDNGGSLSADIKDAHREMLILGVRAVIGCLYVWVALSMRKAALSLRVAGPTQPMGIPAQPGWQPADPTTGQ